MLADPVKEVIFVGLPGPTHNYGGLSGDNMASSAHRGQVSNPREAALQVIGLMRTLQSLGIEVGVLPPQLRPSLTLLRTQFSGEAAALIAQAAKEASALLEAACSSSSMWVANAATVSPGIDNADGKLHLTVANLHTNAHRRIEAEDTYLVLKDIFSSVPDAVVHLPLSAELGLRDEGAANHMRLAPWHSAHGLNVFAYGTDGGKDDPPTARQTLSASKAVAAKHATSQCVFVKQNAQCIRKGVFHNDVIAVANESVLLVHEEAYAGGRADIERIAAAYRTLHSKAPVVIIVRSDELTVEEAVQTYFFNSQIVSHEGYMTVIAPMEVKTLHGGKAFALLERICADPANPIKDVICLDLRQSMHNGGGPACLRLRVPMTQKQLSALKHHTGAMVTNDLLKNLESLVRAHYPESLHAKDLANAALYHRCRTMLTELSALLRLKLLAP